MKILKRLMISSALAIAGAGAVQAATTVTLYTDPTCGCCEKYVDYLRDNGSEVMRRITAPMVGGMIYSTILTLVVIPALYALFKARKIKHSSSGGACP